MAKSLLDLFLDSIFDNDWTGRRGEKLTERELSLVNFLGRKGYTLKNLYLPKQNGETSEVDLVYITEKGIFVFESKNYSGWIFGNENDLYWTASLSNGQKNRFYNPIKQNQTHINWLRKYLGTPIPLFSIIVFSERCELKKLTVNDSDVKVIKRDSVYAAVRNIWDKNKSVLSDAETETLYKKLKPLTDVEAAVKAAHIATINQKYQKGGKASAQSEVPATAPSAAPAANTSLVCPRCGKALLLRTARKGANAGKQFYGCSGFPACRYIKNIDESIPD